MAEATGPREVTDSDLPSLYRSTDADSRQGQRLYLRLLRWDLVALVLGSLAASVSLQAADTMQLLRWLAALLLGAGFVATLVLRTKNYERRWYGGRAAAESIKTSAWKYMMRAEPFLTSLPAEVAEQQLLASMRAVLAQGELSLTPEGSKPRPQITTCMREVRALELPSRKAIYLDSRVNDQRGWYARKAQQNKLWEARAFTAVMAAQLSALGYSLYLIARPLSSVNLAAVLSTLAAAVLAWMQARQYQELAQSYSVTEQELGLVAEALPHAETEEMFAGFVADAESAISREHTLWVARRDVIPRAPYQRRV